MMNRWLASALILFLALPLGAQQKLVLYEEFTGENCPPCAKVNPGLWALLSENSDKILLVKYQSPIPYQGPLYMQNKEDVKNRLSYYGVDAAPYGQMDGLPSPGDGLPSLLTSAHIAAAAALPVYLDLNGSVQIISGDSISISIRVNALQHYSGKALKLRIALLETLEYPTPPGTNGETIFHNVMRKMYPEPDGLAIENNWFNGQSQELNIRGKIPNYVNQNKGITVAAWIQDDSNKSVIQAALLQQQSSTSLFQYKEANASIPLYPNPAQNEIRFAIAGNSTGPVSCFITDLLGRRQATTIVKTTNPDKTSIQVCLSQLIPGIYFMNIQVGDKTFRQKFIKG